MHVIRNSIIATSAALLMGGVAAAQPPAAAPATAAAPAPNFVTIGPLEVVIDRPIDQVWGSIGGYCDIAKWFGGSCTILKGNGEVGTIRSVGNEVMVAKGKYLYTYAQTTGFYHGTMEAVPEGTGKTKIVYTLIWDNSSLADEAARKTQYDSRVATWTRLLGNMKIIAEGGVLPPQPARGAAPAPAPAGGGRGG